jgi:hypothetical protein
MIAISDGVLRMTIPGDFNTRDYYQGRGTPTVDRPGTRAGAALGRALQRARGGRSAAEVAVLAGISLDMIATVSR